MKPKPNLKLFAVYLGGRAPNATLEVHDIAVAVGVDIEATIPQLKKTWFGTPRSLHIDSWVELSHVDGYDIHLVSQNSCVEPPQTSAKSRRNKRGVYEVSYAPVQTKAPPKSPPHGPENSHPKLFFVNIGSYTPGRFGENHHFYFLVSNSSLQARKRAKELVKLKREDLPHSDNVIQIDDVREISEANAYMIELKKSHNPKDYKITNLYWPIGNKR